VVNTSWNIEQDCLKEELKTPFPISVFLLPNIGTNLLQLKAHHRDRISAGPDRLSREVAIASHTLPGDGNGTFAFERANH
jgi:hypothetical protein